MYDIQPCYSATSAKDYLAHDEPGASRWFIGKGYEHLGIAAEQMDMEKFNRLIDNRVPAEDKPKRKVEKLTPRDRQDAVYKNGKLYRKGGICGWYITLSPPKSVTLAAWKSPLGPQIEEALREAGDWTITNKVEPKATVRERKLLHGDRGSGNLMMVGMMHTTSRPVKVPLAHDHEALTSETAKEGFTFKMQTFPQWHLHYFAANASYDPDYHKGARYVAAKIRGGWWESSKINRAFNQRLRKNLHALGIETVGFGNNWTIKGITRDMVDAFSPRRDEARENEEKGVPRNFTARKGRADKPKDLDMDTLDAEWDAMLKPRWREILMSIGHRPKVGWPRFNEPAKGFDFMRHAQRVISAMMPKGREVDRGGPEKG